MDENRARELEFPWLAVGKMYRAFLLLIVFPFRAGRLMIPCSWPSANGQAGSSPELGWNAIAWLGSAL